MLEDNKIIAKYMGAEVTGILYQTGRNAFRAAYNASEIEDFEARGYSCQLNYDKSYDSLMPVIEKIQSECEEPEEIDHIKDALWCADIDTVCKYVAEYIKEYSIHK